MPAIGPRAMANARVGQQGTLTRIWARRGTRPRAPRDTRYKWGYIFGAACPGRGTAAGLVLPYVNTEAAALRARTQPPSRAVMENVWAYLRANKLAITVFDSYEDIFDKCADAWNFFANDPGRIMSITQRDWIKVK